MANDFKKQLAQQRTGVPQVDPESTSPLIASPPLAIEPQPAPAEPINPEAEKQAPAPQEAPTPAHHITTVDTSEVPINRGFYMYPSRHRQIAKDLAYIEDRNPWEIIDDALEEYVLRHYGKEHKRK
jgi:hypothetical protein